jgi:hypothetical protein
MSWVQTEANRGNRNLLVVGLTLGLASAGVFVAILSAAVTSWNQMLSDGWWIPLLALGGMFGLAVWCCAKAFQRYREIEANAVWKRLAVYGQTKQLSAEIDQDLLTPSEKYGALRMTSHWLIYRHIYSTYVSPIADVAWVYELVTTHRTNGIPTGKTFTAVILGAHKQKFSVRASRKKVDALVAELNKRAPWAIFGFSEELRGTWNNNHPAFIAAIDDRRRKIGLK